MKRVRLSASLAILAAVTGCFPTHSGLARQLEKLELPTDYELYDRVSKGNRLGLFGGRLRVLERYRSPRDFDSTCEEVHRAAERIAEGPIVAERNDGQFYEMCSFAFPRQGYSGGILVYGPFKDGVAERLQVPDRSDVLVDARMAAY